MVTELVIVRHGQTDANAAGRLQGRIDLPLNDLGRRQADAAAVFLRPRIDAGALVISSPLQRALDTARAIHPEPVVLHDWIEMDYGVLDGIPLGEVPPDAWARWRSDPDFTPEGGESMNDLARRVRSACEQAAARTDASTLIVVSHVTPIKAAVAWALGVEHDTTWRMHVDQASITTIGISPRSPVLRVFNSTEHLRSLEP